MKIRDDIAKQYDEGPEFIMEESLVNALCAKVFHRVTDGDTKRFIEMHY